MAATVLQHEKVWLDKFKYDDAERQYYESLSKVSVKACAEAKKASGAQMTLAKVSANRCAEAKKASGAQMTLAKVSGGGAEQLTVVYERVWFDKYKYHDAERSYFESLAKPLSNGSPTLANPKPPASKNNPVSTCPATASKAKPSAPKSPVVNPVSIPVCKIKLVAAKPAAPVPAPVNPETSSQPTTNLKTKPVDADATTTNNNKNKEKRFKVKEKTRQKKKEEREKNAINNQVSSNNPIMKNTLADEVAKARQHIQNSLECMDGIAALTTSNKEAELLKRIGNLEITNKNLQNDVTQLKETVAKLTMQMNELKVAPKVGPSAGSAPVCAKPAQPAKKPADDDDDGVDLFGSDSEEDDEEAKKIREQRLAEYASRKSKKPVLIAKSNIILDVKPWDDETNMQELEKAVRQVSCDGLVWGASKLVPLAYGIHKLQISCVVEDDKVSVDWLQETIQEIEDYVQSVDIAAFNKV